MNKRRKRKLRSPKPSSPASQSQSPSASPPASPSASPLASPPVSQSQSPNQSNLSDEDDHLNNSSKSQQKRAKRKEKPSSSTNLESLSRKRHKKSEEKREYAEEEPDYPPTVSEFTKGKIVRVRLNNFYTHSDVEFEPGAGLNLILGPNGSGKSTIACAIHVGLGGRLRSMSRSEKLSDFIRYGCQKGFVELELFEALGVGRNAVVRVTLSKKSSASYKLNGKPSTLAEIRELADKLNIKVDNKCQFLGQECVVRFAQMKRDELLLEMLRVVDINLCSSLERLVNLQKSMKHKEEIIAEKKSRLEDLIEKQIRSERFVRNQKQRDECLAQVVIMRKKIMWVTYKEAQVRTDGFKEKMDLCKNSLKECREKAKPFLKEIRDAEKEEKKAQDDFTANQSEGKSIEREINSIKNQLESLSDKVFSNEQHVKEIHSEMQSIESKIETTKHTISVKEKQLGELPNEEEVRQKRSELTAEKRKLQSDCDNLNYKSQDCAQEITQLKRESREVHTQLKKLDNERTRKINKAFEDRRRTGSEERLYKWVESQRNQGNFQGQVYGPLVLECDVREELHAKLLDAHIGFNVKFGFVVTNNADWVAVNAKSKEYKAQSTIMEVQKEEKPIRPFDMQFLKRQGVVDYLDKTVICDTPVMSALYLYSNLHTVVFSNSDHIRPDQVLQKAHNDRRGCNLLYTPSSRYDVRFSRHAGRARSGGVSELRRTKFFYVTGENSEQQEEFKQQIADYEQRIAAAQAKKREYDLQQRPFMQKLKQIDESLHEFNSYARKRRNMKASLSNYRAKLQELENQSNFEQTLKKLQKKISDDNKKRIQKVLRVKEILAELSKVTICCSVAILNKRRAFQITLHAKKMLSDIQYRIDNLKRDAKDADRYWREYKHRSDRLKMKAEREAPLAEFKERFDDIKENTANDIERSIVLLETRANALYCDETEIKEYYQRAEQIKESEKEQKTNEDAQQRCEKEIELLLSRWLPRVKKIIQKVAVKYGQYFDDIGCKGTVTLKEDEDFSKFELQIFVRFRDDTDLKLLSSTSQSGGERSVSTMLFLLALQEVTTTPFRLVDEINQGMDADNERMILNQIVQNTSPSDAPQYFLVTPKLLPGLNFGHNITVLFVYNGSWMLSQEQWNMKGFVDAASQRNSQ